MITTIDSCRGCGAGGLHPILSLGEQPPANALTSTAHERVATAPLDVMFCPACALVQLGTSLDPQLLFTDYAYFSAFSPTVGASARRLVQRLIRQRTLSTRDLVMEVASNDGYLLRHYQEAGVPVLGIDPARNVAAAAEANGVPTIVSFFTRALAQDLVAQGRRATVVHANNVLAHVPDVNDLVAGIATVLAPGGIVVIETPSLAELVAKLQYDTVYHEHVYYYSATAVEGLLRRHGLATVSVEQIPLHGGSLRITAADADTGVPDASVATTLAAERRIGLHRSSDFARFGGRVDALRARQRAFCDQLLSSGRTLAGYGAAAKATVLLHAIGAGREEVAFVVDQSPHKQGRFLPNTGIPILPVPELAARRPDYTWLFAWNFAEEIVAQRSDYRQTGGRFVIPVPEVRVLEDPDASGAGSSRPLRQHRRGPAIMSALPQASGAAPR